VTWDAYEGEASSLLGKRFEIGFYEKFDGFLAAIDLDANRRISEVHLVTTAILSSDDCVGQILAPQEDAAELSKPSHPRRLQGRL